MNVVIRFGVLLTLVAWITPTKGAIINVGVGQTHTTIQSGYSAASNGDTILIDDGDYAFAGTLFVSKSVTFKAANIGGAHLSGGGSGPDDAIFFVANNASFLGLFFSNSNSEHAIYQRDTGATGTIRNSIFEGIIHPISINNSGATSGNFNVDHVTIVGGGGNAIGINDGGTISIRNSIIVNTFHAYGAHNNIDLIPNHNLLFNVNIVSAGDGNISIDPAQIIANPLFVNAAGHDYHLLANSPAIDAGANLGDPFLGSAPDIGAFEFATVPEPATILLMGIGFAGLLRVARRNRKVVEVAWF